jgi:two-component system cell cycle response regulator
LGLSQHLQEAHVGARILIIEDNPANIELMAYLLTAFGHTALTASDGESGVRTAREQLPDMVVCDVHLPRLDGYGVVAAIKAEPALAGVPVLAVTALAMSGDRERLLAAGFDGYICKPIEPESFVAELEAFLPSPVAAPAGISPTPTLLLVDDDTFMLDVLSDFLAQGGYRILLARSGAEALAQLAHHEVHVVLSDQCMPEMSGTELLALVQQQYPQVFRMILSARSGIELTAEARERGTVERCHGKPWDGAELRRALGEAFRLQQERAAHGAR